MREDGNENSTGKVNTARMADSGNTSVEDNHFNANIPRTASKN